MAVALHTAAGGLNSEVGRALSPSSQVRVQEPQALASEPCRKAE